MAGKLKNNRGATILMALLLLLVATLISCVVLTTVVSTAKTVGNDRARQQAFLNVSSAAQLVKKQITESQIEVGDITTYYTAMPEVGVPVAFQTVDGPEGMQEILRILVQRQNGETSREASYSFSIRSAQGQLGTVNVTAYLDAAYQLRVVLENEDHSHPCRMVLTVSAQAETIADSGLDDNGNPYEKTGKRYLWPERNASITKEKGAGT